MVRCAALVLACLLQACGGARTDDGALFARAAAASVPVCASAALRSSLPEAAQLCHVAGATKLGLVSRRDIALDAARFDRPSLLLWAEATYSNHFSGPRVDGVYDIYAYRYYPSTGNYIGVADERVYVLGPISDDQIVYVGTMGEFRCRAFPEQCVSALRAEDDTFGAPSLNTCRWFDWSVSNGRSSQGNGLRLQTGEDVFSSARVVSQYRVTGDAQLEVTVAAESGFDPIPVQAQLHASFGLMADDNNRFFVALAKAGQQDVIRVVGISSSDGTPTFRNFPDIPIDSPFARLRISRFAGSAVLAYNTDGLWRTAATLDAFAGDAYVELTATNVGVVRSFSALFTDFKIESGGTSWRAYVRGEQRRRADFMAGGTGGDSMNYRTWSNVWGSVDPFKVMKAAGMDWYATDVTFNHAPDLAALRPEQWGTVPFHINHWRSREIVAQDLKNAAAAGLRLYLQLYLSDGPAYAGRQNAPVSWGTLSAAETAVRLRAEVFGLVSSYRNQGINVEVYSIGNEVDKGIVGFTPGGRLPMPPAGISTVDVNYLRSVIWPTEAVLLRAGIEGVQAADPSARIVLHIAGLAQPVPSDIFTKAFFKFMVESGLEFDYAAVSHPYATYPWRLDEYTTDCWMQRLQETSDYIAGLGKKLMITEGNYPRIAGAHVSKPMTEFPFTDPGQAGWVREHLRHGVNNPNMAGFLYWYTDYFVGMGVGDPQSYLDAQLPGLFYPDLTPTPALLEFGKGPLTPTVSMRSHRTGSQ